MDDHSTDHRWNAEWIGASEAQRSAGFARTLLRREFALRADAGALALRVASSGRYVLFVNGEEVARGPQRIQPRRMRHDRVRVDPAILHAGPNVVAAIVTHDDRSDALWQKPVASGRLGAEAALLLEADGDVDLRTDATWRAQRSCAWTVFAKGWLDGVASDCFDARELDPAWAGRDFDDSGWALADVLGAGHSGHARRATPPVAPFGRVPERELATPVAAWIEAAAVSSAVVGMPESFRAPTSEHPADVVEQGARAARRTGRPADAGAAGAVRLGTTDALVIHADLGRVVTGMLEVALDAPAGSRVDVRYEERAAAGSGDLGTRVATRRILREADTFEAFQQAGMRAATIVVAPPPGWSGPVRVGGVRVRERVQRWTGDGGFWSSDTELTALWHAGRRTVQVNSVDAFTDCPTREQRAWTGDGVVHALVHLTTNEDWSAPRAWVSTAASPRDDGILPQSVAGDLEAADGTTIPSWSLHWVHGWYSLYRYAGADADVIDRLSVVRGVLQWFDAHCSSRGLVRATGEWDLVDWSSVLVAGESAALTALWARALGEYAEVCEHIGDLGAAAWAHERRRRAREAFEAFWDDARGVYVDAVDDGVPLPQASQATNGAAVAAGLVPSARVDGLVATIADPARLVVRTVMSDPAGNVDRDKWARISAGERIVDWDVHEQIVRAEPFFAAVVHDAYLRAGRVDLIDRALRDWSAFLRDGFDTFGETWQWGTPCHGWSSTPTSDIVRAILGVTPGLPGYATVRIAPRPAPGTRIEGSVPTPHGPVRVRVDADAVTVESPVPVEYVADDGETTRLPAGAHVLPAGGRNGVPGSMDMLHIVGE